MSKNNDITLEQAENYAFDQSYKIQAQLNEHQQASSSTDDYKKAYELSLTVDILQDDAVIEEIHWELQRGKRSVSDDLGEYLFNRLVYSHTTEDNYLHLYRVSMQ